MDTGLAPGFARITYTGVGGIHHAIVPVNIDPSSTPGIEPDLTLKDGTTLNAEDAISDYVDVWRAFLVPAQVIGLCEIYAVDDVTGEGTFIYGFNLNTVGSSAGAAHPKIGIQLTFKLINGRTFRALAMEGGTDVDIDQHPPFSGGSPQAVFADYVISDTSIVYGRGNAYPFSPLRFLTKEYDALRSRAGL